MEVIHRLFNNATLRMIFLKLRYVLVVALMVLISYYMSPERLAPGFIVSMFGQFIQVWSFASLVKNEELTARGPYVMVRNPMYLGRYFLILGFLVLFDNVYVLLAYTVIYYFYMVNRVQREEKRLTGLLGEAYLNYQKITPRFLPRFDRLFRKAVWFFSWSVLVRNNGQWNFLSTLGLWAIIVLAGMAQGIIQLN